MAPAPGPDDPRRLLPPASPPADGWLRLGSGLGLPIVWMVGSLLAIPLVVYVISYIPWALVEGHQLSRAGRRATPARRCSTSPARCTATTTT